MNKLDIINAIAAQAGVTKKQASAAIETVIEQVGKSLQKGKKVTLQGFGTFNITKRAARKGRNPATGETIKIKAKKVVKFRAGHELVERLN